MENSKIPVREVPPQKKLLKRLEKILSSDPRIIKVECTGSVKENVEDVYSDLDLTITVASESFSLLYKREELERLLASAGLQGLFMYYKPQHWAYLCVALFDLKIFADIVFLPDRPEKGDWIRPEAPKEIFQQLIEIYHRFWLDCLYFSSLIMSSWNYRWEAIRGLNVLRERHLLNLFFLIPDISGLYPSFKTLPRIVPDESWSSKLADTLPSGDDPEGVRKAFVAIVNLFESLYKLRGGPEIPGMEPVIADVQNYLGP